MRSLWIESIGEEAPARTIVLFILFYRHNGAHFFVRATSIRELAEVSQENSKPEVRK